MTKLSTLFFLVNIESESEGNSLEEELKLMEDFDSDLLVTAPEAAVRNVIGFANSYASIPSDLIDEIEVFKN